MQLGIGEIARRTSLKVETIRYYEQEGLIAAPSRSTGGHRRYDVESLKRLRFIRRVRGLGFTLHEIRELLEIAGGEPCGDASQRSRQHLSGVRQKIADLRELEETLISLAGRQGAGRGDEGLVIDALAGVLEAGGMPNSTPQKG